MATIEQCSREELAQKIEGEDDFVLVDALAPISYAASHLPGAISIPPGTVDEGVTKRIPDLDTEVIVYCTSPTCDASIEVAERMIALGYRNVRHYPGGKQEWTEAGLPLEGGRAQPAVTGETTTP